MEKATVGTDIMLTSSFVSIVTMMLLAHKRTPMFSFAEERAEFEIRHDTTKPTKQQ